MVSSYLLSLREGLEAALIIGILLGALRRIQRVDLLLSLWLGVLSAVGVSVLAAVLLTVFGLNLEGNVEKIYEGFTMFLAAGILTWMIFWMSRQASTLKGELEDGVNKAAAQYASGKRAMFWMAFIAVVREGVELALFLAAAFFAGNNGQSDSNTIQALSGTLLGISTAVLLGWSLLASTLRLDLRRFFQVTGLLLILFAAGLVAHGIHEFNEIGWIPAIIENVWDVNALIDENSVTGQLLKTLFGYNGNPALTEMIGYFGYLIVVSILFRRKVK
ncbi:MAG: FTR1 family protein [Chloroflexi bacterium]|nr:FTR1 family protein [Chloroflexota bacterium]